MLNYEEKKNILTLVLSGIFFLNELNGRSLINIQNCCIKALNCKHAFIRYNSNLTYLYDYITIHGGSHENYLVQLKKSGK